MKILIINGVNLNMLGIREPDIYGTTTYEALVTYVNNYYECDFFQSNSESKIVTKIQEIVIKNNYDALIINPGAYSHYSIAILDALNMLHIIKVEVHLSDVLKREEFRKNLITARGCEKVISGYGKDSYIKAIEYIKERK